MNDLKGANVDEHVAVQWCWSDAVPRSSDEPRAAIEGPFNTCQKIKRSVILLIF